MNRIRTWIIRLLQGEAKSTPPDMDQQLRTDHPSKEAAMIMLGKAMGL